MSEIPPLLALICWIVAGLFLVVWLILVPIWIRCILRSSNKANEQLATITRELYEIRKLKGKE